jgi:serine/threonine protein kinase
VARALAYLHKDCHRRILHLDIKPGTILLDGDLHAHVSNFGISLSITRDLRSVINTRGRGTFGYMAPETLVNAVSDRSDVLSYGMTLLELIGGRRNFDPSSSVMLDSNLAQNLREKMAQGKHMELVDAAMADVDKEAVKSAVNVALCCIQHERDMMRPRNPSKGIYVPYRHTALSQEFWVTRIWRLTRESSLQETLAKVYMYRTAIQPSAFTGLRFAPSEAGLYLAVNLEQLQQARHRLKACRGLTGAGACMFGDHSFRVDPYDFIRTVCCNLSCTLPPACSALSRPCLHLAPPRPTAMLDACIWQGDLLDACTSSPTAPELQAKGTCWMHVFGTSVHWH